LTGKSEPGVGVDATGRVSTPAAIARIGPHPAGQHQQEAVNGSGANFNQEPAPPAPAAIPTPELQLPPSTARIAVLDALTASQIAAGEVVERPASVVKELAENSLDAGARHIIVEITNGGLTSMRVRDDGCGISYEDAPLAFASHATSKIRRASDLVQITTLGFRGEALPSIASVARVEMDTRPANEMVGTRIRIAGGGEPEIAAAGCPPGTTVTVTDLFYNTPARRQYLRKPATEARAITAAVEKLALAHPEAAFNLYMDARRLLVTPGNGDLQAVVAALFGLETGRALLPLAGAGDGWTLKGFVAPPWLHRAGRNQQVLTVNGRYIYNYVLTRAVEECYRAVIPNGRHPVFILQLAIDPRLVDVNVHPAKLEVRFQQEYDLARRVAALVNRSLHTAAAVAAAVEKLPEGKRLPEDKQQQYAAPGTSGHQENFRFQGKEEAARSWGEYILREKYAAASASLPQAGVNAHPAPEAVVPGAAISSAVTAAAAAAETGAEQILPPLRAIGQLWHSYILAEGEDGLYIIDQHAAHERCRFARLQADSNSSGSWPAQMLEPPLTLHPGPSLAMQMLDQISTLRDLGFTLEAFGAGSFLLRSVPLGVTPGQEREVLEDFLSENNLPSPERLLKLLACHGAIKAGDPLSSAEMQGLLEAMRATSHPYTCPHGRPAVVRLDAATIARYFHRPVK